MAADNILRSYGDVSRKEDVLSIVEILTAKENWFLTNLGKTVATDGAHITLTDTYRTAASQAVAESGDYTNLALTTPSRLTNIVENIAIPFRVSRTQQVIQKHTNQNEKTRQVEKAMVEWGNAAEFDLVRSTLTSGASGTAPKMSKPKEYGKIRMFSMWYRDKKQRGKALLGMLSLNTRNAKDHIQEGSTRWPQTPPLERWTNYLLAKTSS